MIRDPAELVPELEAVRRAAVRFWAWGRRDMREQMARRTAARTGMPLSELLAYL